MWTDSTGSCKITATFLGHADEKVKLKREDESIIEVPLAQLSVADRDAARALHEKQKVAIAPEEATKPANPFAAPAVSRPPSVDEVTRRLEKGIVFIATRDRFGRKVALSLIQPVWWPPITT